MPNQIDLNDLGKGKYALSIESDTPEDAAARRQEKAEEAKHRRRIHFLIIMLAIVLVLASVFWCGNALLTGSPDDKKWASTIAAAIVSAICSGLIGVAIGQRAG